MGFGYGHRNSGIHRLRSYEEAVKWYDNTKPIRGRAEDKRPLGHRRNVDMYWILKHEDKVECYCYQTPVITFHADGRVQIRVDRWASMTTSAFINEASPFYARVFDHSIVVSTKGGEPDGAKYRQRVPQGDGLFLRKEAGVFGEEWVIQNPAKLITHHIDRKAANNVRGRFKEFRDYLTGVVKLRENGAFSRQEFVDMGLGDYGVKVADTGEHKTHLINMMQDTDKFYEASLWVAKLCANRTWFGTDGYRLFEGERGKKELDTLLLRLHAVEVLKEVETTNIVVDKYKDWLN